MCLWAACVPADEIISKDLSLSSRSKATPVAIRLPRGGVPKKWGFGLWRGYAEEVGEKVSACFVCYGALGRGRRATHTRGF